MIFNAEFMKLFFTILLLFIWINVFSQAPPGFYALAANQSGTALQQSLHNIIDQHTVVSYSGLWSAFQSTDAKSNGSVWDIYSDKPGTTPAYIFTFGGDQCGNYSAEGDCYNREHSFPQSWFNDQSPMVSDLFQVYPTDGFVNNRRGNYPYGETNNPGWTSTNGSKLGPSNTSGFSGTVFEPIDAYKGDLARTYFYMATRYYNEDDNWPGSAMVDGAQPLAWALNMLLRWHQNDPVSDKEIQRNNAIYALQRNRNPFIDHPEYVSYIWGGQSPDEEDPGTEDPGNEDPGNENPQPENPTDLINHADAFSASFITLNWTDAAGAILPDGYLIVYNKQGYESMPLPSDGTPPGNYANAKVVQAGVGSCTFDQLTPQTLYYFKIYSFSGSGTQTDYKTDGVVPQLEKMSP